MKRYLEKMLKTVAAVMLILVLPALCAEAAPIRKLASSADSQESAAAEDEGTWAIYMYVCGSDLESEFSLGTDNLLDLMSSDKTDDTVIVAQTGGTSEWHNTVVDAQKTQRWLFTDGSMELADEQELANMGEAETLADFLTFASTNYPADHTMVIIWDHGSGTLGGCCYDENFGDDSLSLNEMHEAFASVYDLSETDPPVDILGFDCCLMATIDVAATFTDTAHYLIASEETEPGAGWNYGQIGDILGENPDIAPLNLGMVICDSYYSRLKLYDEAFDSNLADTATLSLTDLTQVGKLKEAFASYVDEMIIQAYSDTDYFKNYSVYAQSAENYGGNSRAEGYTDLVDIGDFVQNAGENIDGAEDVLDALDSCVVYKVSGAYRSKGSGLSFYYDYDGKQKKNEEYDENGSIDALKVLYTFGVTDELDQMGCEYVSDLGLDSDELPEITTFEGTVFDGKPVQYNEEGHAYTDFGSEVSSIVTDAMYNVYYLEDGETYYIGSDDEVKADYNTGIVTEKMRGNWGYFGGNLAFMELTYDSDDYNLYSVPVLVNGNSLFLQVAYDYTEHAWSILGARKPSDATYLTNPGKTINLEEGTEVTLLRYRLEADGSLTCVEGDSFIYSGDESFEYRTLQDGRYAVTFVLEDIYANKAESDYAVFDMEDGILTYDPGATVTVAVHSEGTTAAAAAEDGEQHKAALNIVNDTESDIAELYISAVEDDTWGANCLETPLEAGEDTSDRGFVMWYTEDQLQWEIKVVEDDETIHVFDWDLTSCDSENMIIEFSPTDDGGWYITYR